jgi:hypothetical protein
MKARICKSCDAINPYHVPNCRKCGKVLAYIDIKRAPDYVAKDFYSGEPYSDPTSKSRSKVADSSITDSQVLERKLARKNMMKAIAIIYLVVALIILYMTKVSMTDLERLNRGKLGSDTPFLYDTTQFALKVANPNSYTNGYGIFGIVLLPLGILALPATLIADTLSLPYDYYLYSKAKPQLAIWNKVSRKRALLEDFSSQQEKTQFEKHYGKYNAYRIHMTTRHSVGPNYMHPNKVISLYKVAHQHPEHKYSRNILTDIAKSAYDLDEKILDELYTLSKLDIDSNSSFIASVIKDDMDSGFANNYYTTVFSETKMEENTRLSILKTLESAYFRRVNHVEEWIESREKMIREEKKLTSTSSKKEISNRERWERGFENLNKRISEYTASYEKSKNRLPRIRRAILNAQNIEFLQYKIQKLPQGKARFQGKLVLEESCLKLKTKETTRTVIFPASFELAYFNGRVMVKKEENIRSFVNSWYQPKTDTGGYLTNNPSELSLSPPVKCISDEYLVVDEQFGEEDTEDLRRRSTKNY